MSRLSNARTELENYEKTRPADYVSQYQPKIKDVMGQLNGLQNAEKQDYQNYQNDYSNWLNGLQYRQNQYNSASSEHQQRTSNVLNGILSAVGLAAQILPWFFV